jgi:protein-disulfide isomerase
MFGSESDFEVCDNAAIEHAGYRDCTLRRVEDWTKGSLENWDSPPHSCSAEKNRKTVLHSKFHLHPTRRQFGMGAAATLIVGLLSVPFWDRTYFADAVFGADLMRSGPLGEEALGEDRAPHTVIEYASLTCPHCAKFFAETFPALKASYIDTGRVRFILREFPFDSVGLAAAVLARHAEQGKYFTFIQALLREQDRWTFGDPVEPLFAIAADFGFTRAQFVAALTDQQMIDGIDWVRLRAAEKFKVNATPTFFIDGGMYKGEMSLEQFGQALT